MLFELPADLHFSVESRNRLLYYTTDTCSGRPPSIQPSLLPLVTCNYLMSLLSRKHCLQQPPTSPISDSLWPRSLWCCLLSLPTSGCKISTILQSIFHLIDIYLVHRHRIANNYSSSGHVPCNLCLLGFLTLEIQQYSTKHN